jgi:mannose-6-phosphate isomerase-like protein (cupin superfamily)
VSVCRKGRTPIWQRKERRMDGWTVTGLESLRRSQGDPWLEFQRSPDLSTGLYVLAAGEADPQQPHTEDEVYVVVSGRGRFVTPNGETAVEPGSVIFVPAFEEHRTSCVSWWSSALPRDHEADVAS